MPALLDLAVALSRQAGDLLLEYFKPEGIRASQKPDQTLVTEADLAADRLINKRISAQFPQDAIVSMKMPPAL